MSVTIEVLTKQVDHRGFAFEPLAGASLPDMRNVHVVVTEPGQVRGNHVHARGVEQITVSGPAIARWKEDDRLVEHPIAEGVVCRFAFGPGVPHAFKNVGTRPMVLIAFGTLPYDPTNTAPSPLF